MIDLLKEGLDMRMKPQMKLPRRTSATALTCIGLTSLSLAGMVSVQASAAEISDYRFDTASNMLAYTELELSGEPLAESLGLDLDVLDPNEQNKPTEFDYIAGIESYEFSEEGMYELNYRSGLGPNFLNGLRHQPRGGNNKALYSYLAELAKAVALPADQIAKNINLISMPYRSGTPEFAQAVDATTISEETIQWYGKGDALIEKVSQVPAYTQDYKTLSWKQDKSDAVLTPAALGGLLLKEVMWSQDFLGGMHTSVDDEEVEAESRTMDHSEQYSLGVSAVDGMNGLILTELSLEKMQYMQQELGYNGQDLGQKITPSYDPEKSPVWFPHEIAVTTKTKQGKPAIASLAVQDGSSQLRDSWMLLWPLSEFFAFTDQRTSNTGQNPGFAAVFDGAPFAASPAVNTDANTGNDVAATDAFSMASNLSNAVFKNLYSLHFNKQLGTFVDRFEKSKSGSNASVTTYDAAYSLVALSIYQRAQDALPVGYASASSADSRLHTEQGKLALSLIKQQADFIIHTLQNKQGLVADGASIDNRSLQAKSKKSTKAVDIKNSYSIDTQFAAMRGLTAAFLATENETYRQQARKIYQALEAQYFDKNLGTWAMAGKAEYTPWSVAAISSGMRDAILHLKNSEAERRAKNKAPELELAQLIQRYIAWFRVAVSGIDGQPGLQLAEPIGDTGEHILVDAQGNRLSDSDNDGIKQITHAGGQHGRASVLAGKLIVQ